eukprot:XP_014623126.1 UDP-glycosyltransferase 85A3-like [Glycine max]
MKEIIGAPYRARCDALTVTNVSWLPYSEHRGVRAFELISSFQGQLRWGPMVVTARPERVIRQFGYIQSIPPPPVSARLSHDDINDRWMHFAEHVLPVGELCLVSGQLSKTASRTCSIDYQHFAHQPTNCRYICKEWEIGIEIDTNVKREKVEKLVNDFMAGEKGNKMRKKIVELKKKAGEATTPSGCSFVNLDKFIKEV